MLKDLKNWQKRKNKYFKWKDSHRLKNIKIGDKVDVRDTEYIWCIGSVEKILRSKYNYPDLLYIHYEGWSRCYDEYIAADSDRISPLSLYTSRSDIPKYTRHDGPEERVYGNVIEGGDNNNEPAEDNNDNAGNNQNNNSSEQNQAQADQNNQSESNQNDESGVDAVRSSDSIVSMARPRTSYAISRSTQQPFTVFSERIGNSTSTSSRANNDLRPRIVQFRQTIRPGRRNAGRMEAPSRRNADSSYNTSITRLFDDSDAATLLNSTASALVRDLMASTRISRRRNQESNPPSQQQQEVAESTETNERVDEVQEGNGNRNLEEPSNENQENA